jgi:transposase-like protein
MCIAQHGGMLPLHAPFFEHAIAATGIRPKCVTTDKAKCYPPALRAVLPEVEHRRAKYLNTGVEHDHGHLKQRLYPMRGGKHLANTDTFGHGHALIQNVRNGFCHLTAHVPRELRLAATWAQLVRMI